VQGRPLAGKQHEAERKESEVIQFRHGRRV
jgi:hypothetical protein